MPVSPKPRIYTIVLTAHSFKDESGIYLDVQANGLEVLFAAYIPWPDLPDAD